MEVERERLRVSEREIEKEGMKEKYGGERNRDTRREETKERQIGERETKGQRRDESGNEGERDM